MKSVKSLDRTRTPLPMRPGIPARQRHDDIRDGMTSLVAALDVATGTVIGHCHRRHCHQEFLNFSTVSAERPPDRDVHVIMDNYGTHKAPTIIGWAPSALAVAFHANQREPAQSS